MKRTSALKWIVSTVLCLVLVFALLPTAVFAETGTAEVGTWDEFTTALADSSVNTITLTGNIASPQESGDLALVIGSSDRAVTITGGQITVKNAGIILGGDVTFQNIELYFANSVRNAILANGHSLTLDTVTNTSEFDISLFCGGVTDYCGSNISEIPATGTDGHITIKGTNSLGNIYAGSLSDVVDDAADSPNEYTGNATVTIVSGASGMGGIYAHGAREDRSGGNYNVMLNASAKYTVSGGVTINLSNATTTVDGATGGSSNAVVNYVAANGNEAVHTLKNIGALTLSGTTPNLAPATNSTIDTNASVTVPNGARLDLTNFTNTTAADNLTIGSLAGGGTLVLGSDQTLTITGAVTGTTGIELNTAGNCITAENSTADSFMIAGSFMKLTRGDNGVWTAEWLSSPVTDFTVTGATVSTAERTANLPVSVTYADEAGSWDWDFVTVEFTIAVNGNTAGYDEETLTYVDPVTGLSLSPSTEEETFVVEHETGFSTGSYTIAITVPAESTMGGEAITREAELTVTQATCSEHSGGTATCTEQAVCDNCGTKYGDLDASNHASTPTNGFYDCCGDYQAAVLVDDVYEISNAGQLYWFAAQVNGGQTTIKGKLTTNIVVNPGTFAADGTYTPQDGESHRPWTPIGSNASAYNGIFDGAGYTVSGLYFNDSDANEVGLFGFVNTSGTVQNVGVANSYICGGASVGGVVGNNDGTVMNCYNTGVVSGSSNVGGVVGCGGPNGTVTSCYNTGAISGSSNVGGVVGNSNTSTGKSVTSCYNTGAVSGSSNVGGVVGYAVMNPAMNCYFLQTNHGLNGIGNRDPSGHAAPMSKEQFTSGEVCYLLNGSTSEGDLVWGQTLTDDGKNDYPVLGGETVYYGYVSCAESAGKVYTNVSSASNTKTGHTSICSANGNVITASCSECETALGTATITANDAVYTGTAQETATVTYSNDWTGGDLTPAYANNTSAGSATASITLNGVTASVTFTIEKADAAFSAPAGIANLTYTGSAQALVTEGSTEHGTMQYSLDKANWSADVPTATDAKSYTVWYKVLGDSNHKNSDPDSVSVTIGQMDLSGAAVTLGSALTYTGTAQTQSIASVVVNGLTLTAGDYTVTGNQQTGAGDYTLTVIGKGNFTGEVTADWSISKASMTITADNVTVLVGKTAPDVSALTYTVTGLVNGETAEDALTKKPTLSYASTPDTTQEGSYTINISGAEAANYTITYVTGTLTVSEKIPVTITVNVPANPVYDGTDQSDRIKANITAVDTATGEAVTVAGYEYEFSADPISAGSYTLTVSVVDSDEQYVGSVNVSFTIAKRSLTLKADNKSVYVNDSEPEYTFTVTGLVTGHSLSGAVADCADADMTKAGTYDITISTAGLVIKNGETNVTANYAVTAEKGTLTIREYSLPVIPAPTPTPDPEPEETVTVPVTDEDNTVEVEVTVTEGKAAVEDVDLEDLEKVVDGDSNTVTIDFSELDEKITEVELPREVVEKIAETAGESEQTLEIVLSDGVSIEFNAPALNEQVQQTGGISLTVSIVSHEDAKLTREQKTAVGDRPAYDISVTSDGKNISNMGGKITLHAPYELRNGEKPGGLVVYYVDDHGNRERCETHYNARTKRLSWQTDHLSLYMLDYDEKRVEACDGGADCPINAFTDANSKAWYHNGVHYCVENDLMNGISDDLFAPNGTTTRAQIVTILWRLEGKPVVNYLMQFEDIASESWYTEAVRWAASENIVGGYGNGKFGPNDPITRQQMVAILYRYCQYKGIDVSVGEDTNILSYSDAFSISEWAIPAMQWACGSGMIQGIADGDGMKLDPSGSATRAQIATILWRFCDTIMDN